MMRPGVPVQGLLCTLLIVAFALAPAPPASSATPGFLTQKSGLAGCVSDSGTGGLCQDGVALDAPTEIAVSPDGDHAYVVTDDSDAVVILVRGATGQLTPKPGTAGCVSEDGSGGQCQNGFALGGANSVAVSPDGEHVYVGAFELDAVAVFDRNPTTGALNEVSCISNGGEGGCAASPAGMAGVRDVAVSPDGENVYVAADSDDAVAVLDRTPSTGALTQKAGTNGCISESGNGGDCRNGKALGGASEVTVSPDGASVYVAASEPTSAGGVAVLVRGATGALTQVAGTAGCVSDAGSGGTCKDGNQLLSPSDVVVSPDGANVYVTAAFSSAIAIFNRSSSTGGLTQRAGTAGCAADGGASGTCMDADGLGGASGVAVSPDGANVYVASSGSFTNAVAVFDRTPSTGQLAQKAGTAGCVSEFGNSGSDQGVCQDGKALDGATDTVVSPDGLSVYVAATDSAAIAIFDRNEDAPSDTTPPATQITSGPNKETTARRATFGFTGSDDVTPASGLTFRCSLDGTPFSSCTSPKLYTGLSKAKHVFRLRATDAAGNPDPSPARYVWTVK